MNSISIPFEDSINAQALEHESAMVDAYTKMKPDSFKSQLKAALTTYYEDIKRIHGASGCSKTKIGKRKFEDQVDNAGNEDAAADHADVAAASQHNASSPPQASAAAEPPDEPPALSAGLNGLPVAPHTGLRLLAPAPMSGVLVLAVTMAPAARRRAT